jgi:2-keto-4-pentenoate hydratase
MATLRTAGSWLSVLLLLTACSSIDPVQDGSYRVSQAWTQKQPVPLLVPVYKKNLTLDGAYRIQKLALDQTLGGRAPSGFKAALTNFESQTYYGATAPAAAVLLPGGALKAREDGYRIALRDYRQGIVEIEIGYRFAQRIRRWSCPTSRMPAIKTSSIARSISSPPMPAPSISSPAPVAHRA